MKFPGSIPPHATPHATLPESVMSTHQMSRLECPPALGANLDQAGNEQASDFIQTHGGQPQAVLPQGGQGNFFILSHFKYHAKMELISGQGKTGF